MKESPHDGGVPTCSKSPALATHFCKTCEENLCKFDIIKHYKNKFFNIVLIHFDINVSM